MVRSALRANVARPAGSAFVSSARIASTARTPFVASCHQCGSSSSRFTESIRLTTSASPPALSITSFEPLVDLAARAKDDGCIGHGGHVARARLVIVRVAARAQHPVDVHPRPADLAREVRRLRGGRHHGHAAAGRRVVAAGDRDDGKHDE